MDLPYKIEVTDNPLMYILASISLFYAGALKIRKLFIVVVGIEKGLAWKKILSGFLCHHFKDLEFFSRKFIVSN